MSANAVGERETVTLWRPTGPEQLELVRQSGWRAWPPRLRDQPIFYPVLDGDYAVRIARDWNVKTSGVGHVTRFEVLEDFLDEFDLRQVGGDTILQYRIPAERLVEFDAAIVGRIAVTRSFRRAADGSPEEFAPIEVGDPR